MKLFKTTPQPPDGYAILLDNLKQTTAELQNTYANLENVVDPDLIDYYICWGRNARFASGFELQI